jgi:hypothetical protein
MRRIIREADPPRPSHRISTLDAKHLSTIAERQRTDVKQLRRDIEQELDWIVMKAMEKDRTRRYETANGLAADVQRYLDDEPVLACPPSVWYRFRKYTSRHKAQFVTVLAVAALLIVGTAVSSALAAWAIREQRLAQNHLTASRRNERVAKQERAAALDAQALAKQQESLAKQQRALAQQQKIAAIRQRDLTYDNLYRADIRLALNDIARGNTRRLFRNLERYIPASGETDRRGWEWYYALSQSQQSERILYEYSGPGSSVAWSPDGRHVASVGGHRLIVWSTSSWKPVLKCLFGASRVMWSPDGKRLACGSPASDNSIRIVDLHDDSVMRLQGHVFSTIPLGWSPDGKRLASDGCRPVFPKECVNGS